MLLLSSLSRNVFVPKRHNSQGSLSSKGSCHPFVVAYHLAVEIRMVRLFLVCWLDDRSLFNVRLPVCGTSRTYVFDVHLLYIWSGTRVSLKFHLLFVTNTSLWFAVEGFPGLVSYLVRAQYIPLSCFSIVC